MKSLIIDTSSEYCILAIAQQNNLLAHFIFLHENNLSSSLLPQISSLLSKTASSLTDIKHIAVGVGPGSYTGTRVGVAIAKSLAYGLGIPLRGFCSLLAFLPPLDGVFASILPAKSGLFYLLIGKKSKNGLCLSHADLITETDLHQKMREIDFITAKNQTDLPLKLNVKKFFNFLFDPNNLLYALKAPPVFPFEINTQLIYLHVPHPL